MAQASHNDVLDALGLAAESVVDGLRRSPKLLDPKTSPSTRLHKAYSIHPDTTNTGKYRDHRSQLMRLAIALTVRVAWRLNPKDEAATQRAALDDEDRLVRALQVDARDPLPSCRIKYVSTRRSINPAREWLFADVLFNVEFDRSLLATHNQ
jgi:hypothetical protein